MGGFKSVTESVARRLYFAPFPSVTACNLGKSFSFDNAVEYTSHTRFPIHM